MSEALNAGQPGGQENPSADIQKSGNGQCGCSSPAPPPVTDSNPAHNAPNSTNHQTKYSLEWWKTILEIVFFLLAVPVAIFAGCQWSDTHRQLGVMQDQLDEMKSDSTLDERAWVVPFEMTAEKSTTYTNGFYFKLMFKNTGKTPALNVSESHNFAVGISGVLTNDPPIQTNSMLLAPDGISFIKSGVIDAGTIEVIRDGDLPEFIYGKIVYDDIFGKHHWTQFCWSIEDGLNFRPAPVHNSTDDAQQSK